MSKIDDLIKQYCPNGVKYKELGNIVNILDNQRKPVSKDKRIQGDIPYFGANGIQDWVNDYIFDGTFLLVGEDGSVINKDNTPVLNWATGKIWVNNHAHILSEKKEEAVLRYIFFSLSKTDISAKVRGIPPKLNQQNLRSIKIPVPPLPVQKEIVRILDAFSSLEAELEAELEARKKQYEYYRNKLLTFDENTTGGGRIKFMQLGEVAKISNGKDHKHLDDGEYPVYGSGGIMRYANNFLYNKESVLIPRKGSIGNIFYTNQPFWTVDTIFYTKINFGIMLPKFFYHFLKTQHLEELNFAGGVPSLTKTMLDKIQVPIPPLEEQERIVAILDKFDSLVNDISEGLPAELTARRQQYEYYRNKLLAFSPLESEMN